MSKPFLHPKRDAAIFALTFIIIMVSYIHFSTMFAFSTAKSMEELQEIERLKGMSSMIVVGILLYVGAAWAFSRNAEVARRLVSSQQKLVQAEREAISGLLASTVSHDVANLMTIQRLSLERLKSSDDLSDRARDSVERLDRVTGRLSDIVSRLRTTGRSLFKGPPKSFDVSVAIADTIGLMKTHEASRECDITFEGPTSLALVGYPVLVHQLVMNLILNAAEATKGKGRILVQLEPGSANEVEIAVNDDGPGIDDRSKELVFQPFYTTKATGSGLGLTSVRSSVDIHGGSIEVSRSARLGGARFKVVLPPLDESRVHDLTMNAEPTGANHKLVAANPLLG